MSVALETKPTKLTPIQRQCYREDGFLILRGVFSGAEMAMLSIEVERLLQRIDLIDTRNLRCRWQNHVDTDECKFDAFDPVIDLSPLCDALARDPRLFDILGDIYGEAAHLFKDKIILKPPGAKGYDLHQDYIAWPRFPKSFITV